MLERFLELVVPAVLWTAGGGLLVVGGGAAAFAIGEWIEREIDSEGLGMAVSVVMLLVIGAVFTTALVAALEQVGGQ